MRRHARVMRVQGRYRRRNRHVRKIIRTGHVFMASRPFGTHHASALHIASAVPSEDFRANGVMRRGVCKNARRFFG
jgi:hypothetical protein